MILYFADRNMDILGQASTGLPKGLSVSEDKKVEDVDSGVSTIECYVNYTIESRDMVERCCEVGNYLLRSNENENEFYTIIESELDTKKQQVYIYAEDAGMDLLNEVVGEYAADKAYPISHYINKYAANSGFQIGINEADDLTRKLSWDGESTATERIASIATQFGGCEVSYTFDVKNLVVTKKYINIFKKRGHDNGVQLRLNKEIDGIITKKSIANIATALQCTGGTPEDDDKPITLAGHVYDDGDFYIDGSVLKSRKALDRWSRLLWRGDGTQQAGGYITKLYSYDTLNKSTLCANAITELKKLRDMEVNYEADLQYINGAKIGDRVNIIDDAGNLYLSTRLLKLETSVDLNYKYAILGEYIIKNSGISQKVAELAENFSKNSLSAARALAIANNAKTIADNAQTAADTAAEGAENAQSVAAEAKAAADTATQSAAAATEAADAAKSAVDAVEESVSGLESTIENAQAAAEQAKQAAETAQTKATEAHTAAVNAGTAAGEAKTAAETAKTTAEQAKTESAAAKTDAEQAKTDAAAASTTAAAAKADAEQAQADVDAFGESLTTLSNTMAADYARKTELTATESALQTQITQNAAGISSNAQQITTIDETANNAATLAGQAQTAAAAAQSKADTATAEAAAAQTAANNAASAAASAQTEADNAKAAAATAQGVADKANTDLEAAKADLATVTGRVDATEEEIEAAQTAVETAQAAANKAKEDAAAAASKADTAQSTANTAKTNADNAQTAANNAASAAAAAQKVADEAKGDASAAQAKANEAAAAAATAQSTANTAVANAAAAQSKADTAAADAAAAATAASAADAKAAQAAADLATAEENLAAVTGRVDATEEEVAAAQEAVATAQAAANLAKQNAATAQGAADKAKEDAAAAQTAADNAKSAADKAQADATAAKAAADKAQDDVDALAVRVTSAETSITQNSEQIALRATKTEVEQTLGGYYTKEEANAAIELSANGVKSTVSSEITEKINDIEIGGRNLIKGTSDEWTEIDTSQWYARIYEMPEEYNSIDELGLKTGDKIIFSILLDGGQYGGVARITSYSDIVGADKVSHVQNRVNAGEIGISFVELTITEKTKFLSFAIQNGDTTKTSNILKYKRAQLECGTKISDWTPAPEDMATADSVDVVEKAASDAMSTAALAQSAIEQLADQISMMVTDGEGSSLMTQTENGWTFNISGVTGALNDAAADIDELKGASSDMGSALDGLKNAVNDLGILADYVIVTTYNGQPCIELGESDSAFKLRITNTEIQFVEGATLPAYISNKMLHISKARVDDELQFGGFAWKARANGNMGLIWKGVE